MYDIYMKLDFKYTILYLFVSLCLFWLVIKYGTMVLMKNCSTKNVLKEGLTDFEKYSHQIIPFPKDAVIDYNNLNSPEYSHTVNLPINDPVSCKNFCGPKGQCVVTREQCISDIDCSGCNPGLTTQPECTTKDVDPYDAAGKLGQNQGLQYSPLTTGYNNHNTNFAEVYPGSKDVQIKKPYEGVDLWTESFNKGLELYNKKRESNDKYSVSNLGFGFESKKQYYEPKYPVTISATGQFYETTPPGSNAAIKTGVGL